MQFHDIYDQLSQWSVKTIGESLEVGCSEEYEPRCGLGISMTQNYHEKCDLFFSLIF